MRAVASCLLVIVLFCCLAAPPADAQTEYWNRRAVALDLAPSSTGPGLWDVTALADVVAENASSVRTLSTVFLLYVNGSPAAAPLTVDVQLNGTPTDCIGGCGPSCGSMYIDSVLNTMLCHKADPTDCDCGYWITPKFPDIPAAPGDEITVLLQPASGSPSDTDTSDDQVSVIVGTKRVGWNRRGAEIQVQPASTGPAKDSFFDISYLIELEGSGFDAFLDMSMELELLVNGTPAALPLTLEAVMEVTPWDCEDQCGSNCGGMYLDGAINTMTCHLDGPIGPGVNDCDCGYWILGEFPGISLMPGDEIMVLLRPAPGAVPEPDTADDQTMIVFNGRANGWNRGVGPISIQSAANGMKVGDQFFDVWVELDLESHGLTGVVDLSTELELLVNGVPTSTLPLALDLRAEDTGVDCESDCGSNCGGLYYDGVINTMSCRKDGQISPGVFDCDCGYWISAAFPDVPLDPGDEIMVLLRPAPGAVPEPMTQDDLRMRVFSGPAGWDRQVHSISVLPTSSGPTKDSFFDITPVLDISVHNTPETHLNLSTELELLVNGTPVAQQLIDVQVAGPTGDCESGCGGGCGGLYVDGVINTMTCRKDGLIAPGVFDCDCGYWILAPTFPGVGLNAGDEIMVLLRPAPGALPEHEPGPDQLMQVMDTVPYGWNRGLRSLALADNGMGGFELGVATHLEASSTIDLADMSYEIVVEADGEPTGIPPTIDVELVALDLSGKEPNSKTILCDPGCLPSDCGIAYTHDPQNTLTAGCVNSFELGGCACGVDVYTVIPDLVIPPGTVQLTVLLRPAPGALPELPGLEEDDRDETDGGRTSTEPLPARLTASLEQNEPNPFNPRTTIAFTTTREGWVRLSIYDVQGKLVRTLLDEDRPAGSHTVRWDGRDSDGRQAASGQYLYRIETEDWSNTKKMTLLK